MKLLLLVLIIVGGTLAYPLVHEGTSDPCAALEQRGSTIMLGEAEKQMQTVPPALRGLVQTAVRASAGGMAANMIRERYPQIPPQAACVAVYWKSVADPEMFQDLARKMVMRVPEQMLKNTK